MQIKSRRYRNMLIAACLAVPLALFGITAWLNYRTLVKNDTARVMQVIDILDQNALHVIETQQLVAQIVRQKIQGMNWQQIERSRKLASFLRSMCSDFAQIDAIWLIDQTGIIRNASMALPDTPVSAADRTYFHTLSNGWSSYFIGTTRKPRIYKKSTVNFALRRESRSGVFDGVIVISVQENYFSTFWRQFPEADVRTLLFKRNGQILAESHPSGADQLAGSSGSPLSKAVEGKKGSFIGPSPQDSSRIYAHKKLDKYDLYLMHSISMNSIYAQWKENLLLYGLLYTTASLLLLLPVLGNRHFQNRLEQNVAERTEQLEQEIAVRRQYEQDLVATQKKQFDMATRLSLHDQQVRLNIATELHDQIGQTLLLCRIKLSVLDKSLQSGTPCNNAGEIVTLLDNAIKDVRSITTQLSPPILSASGLVPSLEHLCNQIREDYELLCCCDSDHTEIPLSDVVRSVLYQAVRELLINVAKHAKASIAFVTLSLEDNFLIIDIHDNGIGFPADFKLDAISSGGFGLFNIRRQISFLGGRFITGNQADGGATVKIYLPLQAEPAVSGSEEELA